MYISYSLVLLINIYVAQSAILLWSNKKLNISPLKPFNDDDFENLIDNLENPYVYIFKNPTNELSPNLKYALQNFYSAYNPNGDISSENATDLLGDEDLDRMKLAETIDTTTNFLSVIIVPNRRSRRDADESTTSSYTTTFEPEEIEKKPEGSVMYIGKSLKETSYTMLYSSEPLLLQINDTKYSLGNTKPDLITLDNRLNVIIPVGNRKKITLRFNFSKLNGYWSLLYVRIESTAISTPANLTASGAPSIGAPIRLSYHCSGETVLTDASATISLTIYDLQLQIDAGKKRFDSANDCVNFTTVPIWSGIFVTALLGFGLTIALIAIMDIKTMDKFDNQKTKQLSITISE